ncbi:glycoside hydrolase family 5 protein [Catenovulum sp. SX2]|uniref:glycoside hydrolase family 5 protein n=1 Tax=Catenovulum sp. SX2 TaxID=3398614 RepID=UPI003F825AF5
MKSYQALTIALCLVFITACGSSGEQTQVKDDVSNQAPPQTNNEQPIEIPSVEKVIDHSPLLAIQAVAAMGIGINLGNTLDAPHEGEWALAAEEKYLVDFKAAGFQHVRIPVTWHNHVATQAPYLVESAWMDRVEQIVDWALQQDLYVILNAHHEAWLKNDYSNQANKNRFDAIWLQITDRFKHKSNKLIFEILNEPNGMSMSQINQQNNRTLSIIRNTNPTRLVVYSGNGYTPVDSMLDAAIPDANDQYLIANFHSYDPWPFAGQCLQTWGTEQDKLALEEIYQRANTWSQTNGIPVTVNEFGAAKYDFTAPENICDLNERLEYLKSHVAFSHKYGIAATFWDDGGSFSTYVRAQGIWGPEMNVLVEAPLQD